MQGCGLRDRAHFFEEIGATILGASFDPPQSNLAFKEKKSFPFSLLSDPERTLGMAYGACTERSAKYPDRITYVIDAEGVIERAYAKVSVHSHSDDVLRDLGVSPPRRGLLQRLFGKK